MVLGNLLNNLIAVHMEGGLTGIVVSENVHILYVFNIKIDPRPPKESCYLYLFIHSFILLLSLIYHRYKTQDIEIVNTSCTIGNART
jgi:hypothetical protein